MSIKKAVILAAGYGTRVLPATKAIPKELLPVAAKPAIQYIVEELTESGVHDILIVINSGKDAIAAHFSPAPCLESFLESRGNPALDEIRGLSKIAKISFVVQRDMKGTGDAVLCAENFVAPGEMFVMVYPDDIIIGDVPATRELIDTFELTGRPVVGMLKFPREEMSRYGNLGIVPLKNWKYGINDMIEKPADHEILSDFAAIGRCILPHDIFDILKQTPPGAGGEIQLTDAMKVIARGSGMAGVPLRGTRLDTGSKLGLLKANVLAGLKNSETAEEFAKWLKELKID